jgi:hypothetical protein
VPADTEFEVLGREGDWLKVKLDNLVGYVYNEVANNDQTASAMKVTVFTSRRSVMNPGETVYLTSRIEGFDGYETKYQWQRDSGSGFEDVAGANGDGWSFEASVETLDDSWRLVVYYR